MTAKRQHHLAHHVDEVKIAAALRLAEADTTGRIVVTLSAASRGDIVRSAMRAFEKLELHRADRRNNILFFVVPSKREFAVVGDSAAHQALGQNFWDRLALSVSEKIKAGDLTNGLIYGIEEAGRALASRFPKLGERA